MNLYIVYDKNYDWCCFAFDVSRNKAKLRVAEEFYCDYIDMRCKTIKKGLNISSPFLVDHPDTEGYDIVKQCGYEYEDEPSWI